MKKIIYFIFLTLFLSACKKETNQNNSPELVNTSEAKAEHNTKSGGVYKGVLIGSSGVIKIILQDNALQAIITIDGVSKTLATTNLNSWTSGQPVSNALFKVDNWQITFSVAADGSNPQITANIPGHANMAVFMAKETSSTLIKAYEGTYSGASSGTWNFVILGNKLMGIAKGTDSDISYIKGDINGTNIIGTAESSSVRGTINGNEVSGTYTNSSGNGTWKGKRTL